MKDACGNVGERCMRQQEREQRWTRLRKRSSKSLTRNQYDYDPISENRTGTSMSENHILSEA